MNNKFTNMKKIRGVIEPYTLGFLISIIGTTIALLVDDGGNNLSEISDTDSIELIVVNSDESFDSE